MQSTKFYNIQDLKIGYVPYLPNLSQPADRRRFPFFAKSNDIAFEVADINKNYDIILLTAPANLTLWLDYKKRHSQTKFIFEMVDSLILPSDTFTYLFQGIGRFAMTKEKKLSFIYRNVLITWIKQADAVICSSTEMKRMIEPMNKKVFVSLDYMQNEVKCRKVNFEINGNLKLVWEGQGVVARHLLSFKDMFRAVNSFCELHVITDPVYPSYGNLIKRDVQKILDELPIKTVFHQWEIYINYEMLIQFDCGIIPLRQQNRMAWHKPANKLISFWFAGLPTLVSNTPAYVETMKKANCDMFCRNTAEWIYKIEEIRNMSVEKRKTIAEMNRQFVQKNYSNESITASWFEIFEKVLEKVPG
jgi:glycosyltransferase involved in cell wall biosynthesis